MLMSRTFEIDVWLRGTTHAATATGTGMPAEASAWTDEDIRTLLTEMLLAIDREKHPEAERPLVTLRGFSWIVSPYESAGVVLHVEMQTGTASAGPFQIDEARLTAMITRVLAAQASSHATVH